MWNIKLPLIIWIMMNPSTADHLKDDPTIRKIVRYSTRWGYGAALILNAYAYRTSKQHNLPDDFMIALGYSNRRWLSFVMSYAKRRNLKVICAWGAKHERAGSFVRGLSRELGVQLWCLELAASGEPKHPLWLKETLNPIKLKVRG